MTLINHIQLVEVLLQLLHQILFLRLTINVKKLNAKQAVEFHHLVAKILFATKRASPDTCTAISFLATRVREPDNDDWANFIHLMKYIIGTSNLPLILSANGSIILNWWIDGSFSVHPNMRGRIGGGLSMGKIISHF